MKPLLAFLFCAFLACFALQVYAWEIPKIYQQHKLEKDPSLRLDYFLVEINGKKQVLKNGEEFSIVKGDEIQIVEGYLVDKKKKIEIINLVGFVNPKHQEDDRGFVLDTVATFAGTQWAVDLEGKIYGIVALTNKSIQGSVFMHVMDPRLEYVEIELNAEKKVMREGETFVVDAADKFKILQIQTNLKNQEDIRFFIQEKPKDQWIKHIRANKQYEIQVHYKSNIFAKIPFLVENQ